MITGYRVPGPSGEICETHRGDMGEKGIQFLIGIEDAILSKIIGRRYRPYPFPPRLLVDRLGTVIRRHCRVVSSVRTHRHPR
jgi:hypothetical protein